ncbi:MAG: Maf family protein [Gaiellales bacterium]
MSGAAAGASALVLASTSPRRRAILEQLGIEFEILPPGYVEAALPGCEPEELVARHARGKAESVADAAGDRVVLGLDTTVALDGAGGTEVLGKPRTVEEAGAMLRMLSGRVHRVLSGLCVLDPSLRTATVETTRVTFRQLSDAHLSWYLASGEWQGLAGSYAIQGRGATLVERVDGDYFNVVGLPIAALVDILEEAYPGRILFA